MPTPQAPGHDRFVIAHRAGNDLRQLRAAADRGARLIEADIRLYRGRLEVRHLKTVGPLPILWDRWYLANPFARRLQLHELLAAVAPLDSELMLDLKGRDQRLAQRVVAEIEGQPAQVPVTICARSWKLLDAFAHLPHVRTVCSVGTRRGLRRLLARHHGGGLGGVSIHADLLDAPTVAQLSHVADIVMTWPVNTAERAGTLLEWGVHGLITDDAAAIEQAFA